MNTQPNSNSQAIIVILSGRVVFLTPLCSGIRPSVGWAPCGDPAPEDAKEGRANCSATFARVKNTSHQMPIPIRVSQNPPITIRTVAIAAGSGLAVGAEGNRITSMTSPVTAPMKLKSTEKTMIEMRAQFLSLHKPMAVATPQVAGSKYTRDAAAISALNVAGEPGNCGVWPFGTKTVTANNRSPIANVSREPIRDRIETTVTPVERVIHASP